MTADNATPPQGIDRDTLVWAISDVLMRVYDNGTSPNARREAEEVVKVVVALMRPVEAATPPQGIDRDTFLALLDELSDGDGLFDQDELYQGLLALVRPVEGGSNASS